MCLGPVRHLPYAVRRSARLAPLVLAALLPAVARAEEVHTHLTGKVYSIQETPAGTVAGTLDKLAALGVAVDAAVSIDFSVDSAAVATSPQPPYVAYQQGVISSTVKIGDYEAHLDHGVIIDVNFVQVGNDVVVGLPADSYDVLASGVDTDNILLGPTAGFSVLLDYIFSDSGAKSISDTGIVQDVTKFQFALGTVGGANGQIFFNIDVGSGGGGGGGDPSALARKGQLQAASKFGGALLKTHAKFAAAPPEKDPFGAQEAKLVDKAHDTFLVQFVKAVDKALKKGGSAPLPASAKEDAAQSVLQGCDALVESLLAGADPLVKDDRALRGKLLRAAAAQCAADLAAHAKDVLKPNPAKLADKLAKSRAKLQAAFGKALDKADKQGLAYTGPGADEVADTITTLVDAYVQLTADGL